MSLAWGQTDRAVEPNGCPVQERVYDDLFRQQSKLMGFSQTGREWNVGGDLGGDLFGQPLHHWRLEQARGNRHDPDTSLSKFAGGWQAH